MSCGVGHRCSSGPMLLRLWCRPVAIAWIGPLAWEPPYATGAAQEMAKRKKKKKTCLPWPNKFAKLSLLPYQSEIFAIHSFPNAPTENV